MKNRAAVAVLTSVALAVGGTTISFAANVSATPISTLATSGWTPPSSDPSGITFIPGKGLLVSDAEIEESALTAPINHNNNLISTTLAGVKTTHGSLSLIHI